MPTPPRHLARRLAALPVQLTLAAAAFGLASVPTQALRRLPMGFSKSSTCHGVYAHYLGYPVPWIDAEQGFTVSSDGVEVGPEEPVQYVGCNPSIPLVMLVAAVTLPPAVAGAVRRAALRTRGVPRPPLSRSARLNGVLLLASVVALSVSWAEAEASAILPGRTPWSARPPGAWVDTAIYQVVIDDAADGRRWLCDRIPATRLWLAREWPARTRLTVTAFVCAAVVGCGIARPWRPPADPCEGSASS